MSVDFAIFDLTELAVLDAPDMTAVPGVRGSAAVGFVEDLDSLISGSVLDLDTACCSCSSTPACCCTG